MSDDQPTIQRRLQPSFILVSTDDELTRQLTAAAGDWKVTVVPVVDEVGEWHQILLYRFIFFDLDHSGEDTAAQVERLRTQHLVNIPAFGLGGTQQQRDEARKAGCDRFFDRDEAEAELAALQESLGWGKKA
jgi:hypothetical protein